mmetsp:Transcript_35665/g.57303  ORF Transcript_35665/g.57303 Transcript_35665/m.57303 type:complete len:461 (+) Transcript_35665:2-1384(+)
MEGSISSLGGMRVNFLGVRGYLCSVLPPSATEENKDESDGKTEIKKSKVVILKKSTPRRVANDNYIGSLAKSKITCGLATELQIVKKKRASDGYRKQQLMDLKIAKSLVQNHKIKHMAREKLSGIHFFSHMRIDKVLGLLNSTMIRHETSLTSNVISSSKLDNDNNRALKEWKRGGGGGGSQKIDESDSSSIDTMSKRVIHVAHYLLRTNGHKKLRPKKHQVIGNTNGVMRPPRDVVEEMFAATLSKSEIKKVHPACLRLAPFVSRLSKVLDIYDSEGNHRPADPEICCAVFGIWACMIRNPDINGENSHLKELQLLITASGVGKASMLLRRYIRDVYPGNRTLLMYGLEAFAGLCMENPTTKSLLGSLFPMFVDSVKRALQDAEVQFQFLNAICSLTSNGHDLQYLSSDTFTAIKDLVPNIASTFQRDFAIQMLLLRLEKLWTSTSELKSAIEKWHQTF